MSKGLGKTQKQILRLLGTQKWKSMSDLMDKLSYNGSNHWPGTAYMAIYRAIRTLEKRGLVEITTRMLYGKGLTGQYASRILKVRKLKC